MPFHDKDALRRIRHSDSPPDGPIDVDSASLRVVKREERSRQSLAVLPHPNLGLPQALGQEIHRLVRSNRKVLRCRVRGVPLSDYRPGWHTAVVHSERLVVVALPACVLELPERGQQAGAVGFVFAVLPAQAELDRMPVAPRQLLNVLIAGSEARKANFLNKNSKFVCHQ